MRFKAICSAVMMALLLAQSASAAILAHNTTYTFSFENPENNITGDDALDVASGAMTIHSAFDGTNTTITTQVWNTSPSQNPGITGFGFDTTPANALNNLVSWSMSAYKWNGSALVLDSNMDDFWNLTNTNNGNGDVDLFDGSGNGQYALYNPAVAPPGGGEASNPRYTLATLIVTLAGDVHALYNSIGPNSDPDPNNPSPYIRLQNTGPNGQGSLKLTATLDSSVPDDEGGPGEVPEPATLAMWGLGLGVAGLVRLVRRKK